LPGGPPAGHLRHPDTLPGRDRPRPHRRPEAGRRRGRRRRRDHRQRPAAAPLQGEPQRLPRGPAQLLHPPRHHLPVHQQPGPLRPAGAALPGAARPGAIGPRQAGSLSLRPAPRRDKLPACPGAHPTMPARPPLTRPPAHQGMIFPLSVAFLLLLAVPGAVLLGFSLAGREATANAWLPSTSALSYHTPIPAWAAIILFLIPFLVVLLYFLKLRRKPLEVPSTFLWRKSIEDLHVNALFQWLRDNLLLLM